MHVHNMQRQEEDYTMVRGIKYIEGKSIKSGTNFVTQKQTNGSTLEITYNKKPGGSYNCRKRKKLPPDQSILLIT